MTGMELISRKEALDALRLVTKTNSISYVPQYARLALKNIPAIDAVPVVRCKHCKHGKCTGIEYLCDKHSGHVNILGEDRQYQEYHDGDWYCADGERRQKHEQGKMQLAQPR